MSIQISKLFIKNRIGFKIAVELRLIEGANEFCFVQHGYSGYKEGALIQRLAETFNSNNISVVLFDTTNSTGESEGRLEDATLDNFCTDLEDVISWASTQKWYKEPFYITGHSMGGYSIMNYSKNNPKKIKIAFPISPFISGERYVNTYKKLRPQEFNKWEQSGWRVEESTSRPGLIKRTPFSLVKNQLKHDLTKDVENLRMQIYIITGRLDKTIQLEDIEYFFNCIPSKFKKLYILNNSEHKIARNVELDEVSEIINNILKSDHE